MLCSGKELILLIIVVCIIIANIFLSIFIRINVPLHVIYRGKYYVADGQNVSFHHAVTRCSCLRRIFPDGKPNGIVLSPMDESTHDESKKHENLEAEVEKPENTTSERKRRELFDDEIIIGNFVLPVLRKVYIDDDELIFACNSIIYNKNLVLSRKKCIESPMNNGKMLYVRSGSPYWSKYGILHNVTKFKDFNEGLVALWITPKIKNLNNTIKNLLTSNAEWNEATSFGWNENINERQITVKSKFEPLEIIQWSKNQCDGTKTSSFVVQGNASFDSGKFLITPCYEFVGFETSAIHEQCNTTNPLTCPYKYDIVCENTEFSSQC